jgi:hypothetical protein
MIWRGKKIGLIGAAGKRISRQIEKRIAWSRGFGKSVDRRKQLVQRMYLPSLS